ncbi:LLM class flavin-dependent oxidoreductase [Actinomadura hibisca]|uniref:LLM class flavin-dependent oxidoreductase n=1 Tax=Actinomadura hibisca TaxID=68565 RepID=UPI000833C87C|nr:LLM class flavin-dependent oxidoreductase [Actinomadura hibisca]
MSTPEFHLVLPTRGGPAPAPLPSFVTDLRPGAFGPLEHLAEIGRAADVAGFHGVLTPFDPGGEESLVVTAGLLRQNRWLRGIAGFHPGIATPVYAAKVSASLQRFSGDRLDWRLTVDLDPAVARSQGDFLEGADRYVRADEFLTIAKGVWHEEDYTYEGRYFQVLAGGFQGPLAGRAFPRVLLSGTSTEALELSAEHADVHLFGLGDDLDAGIAELSELSVGRGPTPAFGLRLPVLVREDRAEAEAEARRRGDDAPAGLFGSYGEVADTIRAHLSRGVTVFVLEAEPGVEETYRLGEHLLPLFTEEYTHAD